ncbi:DNA recombination protein RmuC [Longimicrobium sp.]|uniref:DNA recombination protein RmuC n=1 Tax=Longimicrobium sp. TaxID=2029185 RepID=UPI002B579867|nr:DNA recombination protein RmuC [Longimicrobium sp.]HSU17160.1 DNA recombination protein RmuC [Longimicrobium sp.]
MPIQILLYITIALLLLCAVMLALLLRRGARTDAAPLLDARLSAVGAGQERTERAVREEIARSREEAGRDGHLLRGEVTAGLSRIGDQVFQNLGVLSARNDEQLAQVLGALREMTETGQDGARRLREEVGATLKGVSDSVVRTMGEMSAAQKMQLDGFATQIGTLTASSGEQMDRLRLTVEGRLDQIRDDNTAKLEQVRQTVDEKLQGVLEQRLGESFRAVSERLEQVHRGLGEMQTLASGVGDLKRVLQNVKVRGTWGEVQLGKLLEQVLTPEQYAANVATNEFNGARVEFAIRLPGHDLGPVWLPIDAKFPLEDYQRLLDAHDAGDLEGMDAASKALEQRVRLCARDISMKYLNPPQTTDFAILFLPTEGLYGEVVRRVGLLDALQRDSRVIVAGPITLWAILNSLQMGFRTLAIQQRSSEVWGVLGAVKTEFARFGGVLEKVQKKLHAATREMDQAGVRTRAIERKLREVQELPPAEAERLIALDGLVVSDAGEDEIEPAEAAA